MHVFYKTESKRVFMIAIFDNSENKVVVIGDRFYRMSFDEFNRIRPRLEQLGLSVINSMPNDNITSTVVQKEDLSTEKKYIASSGSTSVIVNDLDPKLHFIGVNDIKSIDEITNTYKKFPEQISKLISAGRLVAISEEEKNKRIEMASAKKVAKGSRIKQSSSIEEKVSSGDYDNSYDDTDDSEDRIIKNAVKIDL